MHVQPEMSQLPDCSDITLRYKSELLRHFSSPEEFSNYIDVLDLDLFILYGFIDQAIHNLNSVVSHSCFGCLTGDERFCDLCKVNLYTLLVIFWNSVVELSDHSKLNTAIFDSPYWDDLDITLKFCISHYSSFPFEHFNNLHWRKERLLDLRLRNYWWDKLQILWHFLKEGKPLQHFFLKTS